MSDTIRQILDTVTSGLTLYLLCIAYELTVC